MVIGAMSLVLVGCVCGRHAATAAVPSVRTDLGGSYREKLSATRERICLNGFWRFQYAPDKPESAPPAGGWGYIKVPSQYTGREFYVRDEAGKVYAGESAMWQGRKLNDYANAWYMREFKLPRAAKGKRVLVEFEKISGASQVFLDGKPVGAGA